jgi:hypothetical protein
MKKGIHKGLTPDGELLKAKEYIASIRGPKFTAHEVEKTLVDPAMEANITRVSLKKKRNNKDAGKHKKVSLT